MSNPKFMTLQDLKDREERRALLTDSEPTEADAIQKPSNSSTSSTSPSKNVHTLSDYKTDEEDEFSQLIPGNSSKGQNISAIRPIYGAMKLLIPISIVMLLVIMYVKFVWSADLFLSKSIRVAGSSQLKTSNPFLTSLMMTVVIAVFTFLLFFLFYYHCYKIIFCILGLNFLLIFVVISWRIFTEVVILFNIPFDFITGCLLLWNYSVLALISIFWKSAKVVQQAFLVNASALVAINLLKLPEWTTWSLLVILIIWDLIAVLCPYGPLRLLMSTFQERKQKDPNYSLPPGLLYSTMIWIIILELVPKDKREQKSNLSTDPANVNPDDMEGVVVIHEGPRLGLGDFVFYSLLMGKAAVYGDFNLIVGCYVGILVGFLLTLVLLVIYRMALPALPISITFGVLIFVISYFCVTPFLNALNYNLIYF